MSEYVYVYIWWANIYISIQFMHIAATYLYIQPVHAYCRRTSIYLVSSCISPVKIYIYIYIEFISIAAKYLYI